MLKKVLKALAVSLLLTVTGLGLSAQTRTVTGKVLDVAQEPLVGVAVLQDGTTNGVVTDIDGSFSIKLPSQEVVLTISSLGYNEKRVKVGASQSNLTVVLEDDTTMLEETVVVGYGTMKKVNLTGAISTVDSKALENRSAHNLTTMLQGSVPGLNISTSSGNPGSTGSLNIRGTTSINSADPLVLIDGSEGDMSMVNPNDVESISVIKDASSSAIYGARAAFGVILITTKSGSDKGGNAKVRYSGRYGWETPTTSTDYETRGYWSAYIVDTFWKAGGDGPYTGYTEHDYAELLARVNDKTENPERPWIVEDYRNGRKQWIYYCNTDWYHYMYNEYHPTTSHTISVNGGNKKIKFFLSGGYENQQGQIKARPDVFEKYNLRSKIDFQVNKWIKMSNNTAYYSSTYDYPGVGNVQNAFQYSARHALACFAPQNPDGSWVYSTPLIVGGNYNVANGRHIAYAQDKNVNVDKKNNFTTTTEIVLNPIKPLSITANYTYRKTYSSSVNRTTNFPYRVYPDAPMQYYDTGAGLDELSESSTDVSYTSTNVFATYRDSFAKAHNLTITAGMNAETWYQKKLGVTGKYLLTEELNDMNLVGPDATGTAQYTATGGQAEYRLLGFFGRMNYDYKGRYLFEISGRYDGTSRFAAGHRWGFFPSASLGWRISEEPFFAPAKNLVNNLKLRASYGSLGNQVVKGSYYTYLREISLHNFAGYSFNEGSTVAKYSSLSNPVSSDLTWETSNQYNLGVDIALLKNKLEFTAEAYIRDTKDMLTDGSTLPGIYGADPPKTNSADLRTKGYELSLSWRDEIKLAGHPFGYFAKATLSDYRSDITKFEGNSEKILSDYYTGMRIGDIWGYEVAGLFESDEEAIEWTNNVCNATKLCGTKRMVGGWKAGDLKYVDQKQYNPETGEWEYDGVLSYGRNTLDNHGDLIKLGNSLASLQYGLTFGFDWLGFDCSVFLQGTGNHYWYPHGFNYSFWGAYGYSYATFLPKDFAKQMWSEDNPDTYFPRPRSYSTTGGELKLVNSRYIQNVRYLRLKNLTVGYTVPSKVSKVIGLDAVRVYFTGENLGYCSPIKKITKYLDPESAFSRSSDVANGLAYPWQKTYMFGIDITF